MPGIAAEGNVELLLASLTAGPRTLNANQISDVGLYKRTIELTSISDIMYALVILQRHNVNLASSASAGEQWRNEGGGWSKGGTMGTSIVVPAVFEPHK